MKRICVSYVIWPCLQPQSRQSMITRPLIFNHPSVGELEGPVPAGQAELLISNYCRLSDFWFKLGLIEVIAITIAFPSRSCPFPCVSCSTNGSWQHSYILQLCLAGNCTDVAGFLRGRIRFPFAKKAEDVSSPFLPVSFFFQAALFLSA